MLLLFLKVSLLEGTLKALLNRIDDMRLNDLLCLHGVDRDYRVGIDANR